MKEKNSIYGGFKELIGCFNRQEMIVRVSGDLTCGSVGEPHLVNFSQKFSAPEMDAPNSAYNSLSFTRYSMARWA
jgi:hypothetical protein